MPKGNGSIIGNQLSVDPLPLGNSASFFDHRPMDAGLKRAYDGVQLMVKRPIMILGHSEIGDDHEGEHVMNGNDALPLEYKLNKLRARRQVDASYFVNDALFQGEGCVLGLGFQKEVFDLGRRQLCALANDRSNL